MELSFHVTKSISKTTLPIHDKATMNFTVTMASDLTEKPRDIVIAWENYGKESDTGFVLKMNDSIREMVTSLIPLTGGANGKLGSGNRVALYGRRVNGEIRTELTDDTAVILAAMDAADADPQDGQTILVDPIIDMLTNAAGRKTVMICGATNETMQDAAAEAKVEAAGIEVFTLDSPIDRDSYRWGGSANASTDRLGAAVILAGMPQNLNILDIMSQQFSAHGPVENSWGEIRIRGASISKREHLDWKFGLPELKTGTQTFTASYVVENLGKQEGQLTSSTMEVALLDENNIYEPYPLQYPVPDGLRQTDGTLRLEVSRPKFLSDQYTVSKWYRKNAHRYPPMGVFPLAKE